MKIRNGFVSNSSSSSFIFAAKEECCEKCGNNNLQTIEFFTKILLDKHDYGNSISLDGSANLQEITNLFSNQIFWLSDDDIGIPTIEEYIKDRMQYITKPGSNFKSEIKKVKAGYVKDLYELMAKVEKINKFLKQNYKIWIGKVSYNDNNLFDFIRNNAKISLIEFDGHWFI